MDAKHNSRRHQILSLLLESKAGLTIDEIAAALEISRTAVQQHVSNLERDGYIGLGGVNKTAGRPVRTYVLTENGVNRFPKQYAWFSELVFADLKATMGSEAFQAYMHKLGVSLSQQLLPRFAGKRGNERIAELLKIMDELGFQTKALTDASGFPTAVSASNCIYHDIAQKHQEICAFDRALIASLLQQEIEQVACMAEGCTACRFKIRNAAP